MKNYWKHFCIVLLVSLTIGAKASPLGSAILGTVFIGTPVTVAYFHYWHDSFQSDNGLYVSTGIDPKMLSELKIDIRQRVYYKYNRLYPSITLESFGWATYESITGGLDYCIIDRKLSLLAGLEMGAIHNEGKRVFTHGINAEIRLHTNNNYSISYISNIKTRPEISNGIVYSGYIHLNIKL